MKIGDIVRIKSENDISQLIPGNCIIDDISKPRTRRKVRYHIKSLTEDKMTWVYETEVDMINNLRNQALEKLGI
jgi:hypothetical protein